MSFILSGDPDLPAILFLHGFMGSGADWADTTSELEAHFFCIAPDLPGHGRSLRLLPEEYTIEGTARTLRDLLDELEISHATLIGYSMGGRLALYLALRYPERCSGLVLESASPGIEDAAECNARRHADEERAKRLESGDFEEFLERWYRQPLFASLTRHEELVQEIIEVRLRNDPRELARSLRGLGTGRQPSLWRGLPGLTAPALAIAGELDEKFVGISRRMAACSPNVRAAVVRGAGHIVHVEAPGAYLALLKRFLGT